MVLLQSRDPFDIPEREGDDCGCHFGRREETAWADIEKKTRHGVGLSHHRQNAILLGSRARYKPLGNFALHHHHCVGNEPAPFEKMEQDRARDIVRNVPDHPNRLDSGRACYLLQIGLEEIFLQDFNSGAIGSADHLDHTWIELDRQQTAFADGKQTRQCSLARTYLHDGFAGQGIELPDDLPCDVFIDEEILSKRFFGSQMFH